ncbi:MAG: hypothetical protein KIS79_02080 [Burkholderiales bacterium]|nr:hypothetical protein [Burkholderiales bacterium]
MSARIVVCGKGQLACASMEYIDDLRATGLLVHELIALAVRNDTGEDTWEPSLRRACTQRGVGLAADLASLRLNAGDLVFSLQFDKIIRMADLGGARAFNVHFSALPRYRGCYPSMWPLRRCEREAGTTLHVLDEGIDSGDIVDQIRFPLPPFFTAADLYRLHHPYGYELIKRNLQAIVEGRETRQPQNAALADYYDRRSIDFDRTEIEDFSALTAAEAVGLLKSFMFMPFQMPSHGGRRIVNAEIVHWTGAHHAAPAAARGQAFALLPCRDGLIRVQFDDTPDVE